MEWQHSLCRKHHAGEAEPYKQGWSRIREPRFRQGQRSPRFSNSLGLQEESALRVETAGGKISLEATFDQQAGEIRGAMQIGRTDVPIVLPKGTSK
jgi:hypothetical protein